jgi:hypothetical protein
MIFGAFITEKLVGLFVAFPTDAGLAFNDPIWVLEFARAINPLVHFLWVDLRPWLLPLLGLGVALAAVTRFHDFLGIGLAALAPASHRLRLRLWLRLRLPVLPMECRWLRLWLRLRLRLRLRLQLRLRLPRLRRRRFVWYGVFLLVYVDGIIVPGLIWSLRAHPVKSYGESGPEASN